MPRLELKSPDGPARQELPVRHEFDALLEEWHVVFSSHDTDGKKRAVYERVDMNGDRQVGYYRHVETLDEVQRD
jgi:hypothetical protein